jgi:hypothetical protein
MHAYETWRIHIRKGNKMQPQPLRKKVCAGHRLNVWDREGKGAKSCKM